MTGIDSEVLGSSATNPILIACDKDDKAPTKTPTPT